MAATPERAQPPSSIRVGPFDYRVHVGGPEWDLAAAREGEDLRGETDHRALRIVVCPGMHPARTRNTVMHEALHAAFAVSGQPLDDMKDLDPEENAVRVLTAPLLGVLRDNPGLVAYLTEEG